MKKLLIMFMVILFIIGMTSCSKDTVSSTVSENKTPVSSINTSAKEEERSTESKTQSEENVSSSISDTASKTTSSKTVSLTVAESMPTSSKVTSSNVTSSKEPIGEEIKTEFVIEEGDYYHITFTPESFKEYNAFYWYDWDEKNAGLKQLLGEDHIYSVFPPENSKRANKYIISVLMKRKSEQEIQQFIEELKEHPDIVDVEYIESH